MSEYSNIFVIQKGHKENRVRLYENSWAFAKMLAYPVMEMAYKNSDLPMSRLEEDFFFHYATINTEARSWQEIELPTELQQEIAENATPDYLRAFINEHCTNHCGALVVWVSERYSTYGNTTYYDGWSLEYAFMAGYEDVYCNRDVHLTEEEAERELHRFLTGAEYFAYHKRYCSEAWTEIWDKWCAYWEIKFHEVK